MLGRLSSLQLMLIGFVLLLFGAVAPFAMMMDWVPSTFPLNFLAMAASLGGFVIGLFGLFTYLRPSSKR
ncbi:MAG: hypothetical protein WBC63_08985 [Candidatus Bipolaricaulia bacterium]